MDCRLDFPGTGAAEKRRQVATLRGRDPVLKQGDVSGERGPGSSEEQGLCYKLMVSPDSRQASLCNEAGHGRNQEWAGILSSRERKGEQATWRTKTRCLGGLGEL